MKTNTKTSTKNSTKNSKTAPKSTAKKKSTSVKKTNKQNNTHKNIINRTIFLYTILAVIFLTILVIGAAFAYFAVNINDNSSSTKFTGTVDNIGSVSFKSDKKLLIMNLNEVQMMQQGKDITYYASSDGTTTNEISETLGYLEVNGNGTFDCDYEFEIKSTSTTEDSNLYSKFQSMKNKSTDQLILSIITSKGIMNYDFNTKNLFPISFAGKATNLSENNNKEEIKAQLKLINKSSIDQTDLEDADITISISLKSFKCEIAS